ncbi:right-handed parallel beta-helix repeat-containing protein [uncultured Methanobrevibacter sp.]|uniref:right-handed parallel beta-helix repeat-containing protein n=1 Tax=uncultured Methanobrevibacter sp. TaxID=253161 RepID=UPI0025EE30AA|nr:right-handed parallel beta-helix repeat-containing protein [uncultured Methanobrevibacter sp.]
MISKKYIILSIFLLSLLTLSVVSAADNATNDVISLEESNDSISVEETQAIQQNDNNEVLSSNEGTFDDLQTIIDAADENSTILLENNYKYNDGFDNNGINIAKNLTIDGGGHTIDGDKKGRIFNVLNDNFVIFKNIIFVNGHTDKEGGAIYGKGTVMNCTFNKNYAGEHGGAISYANAINCTFNENEAIMGGAIFNSDATDCIFNHNNAVSGGAAYSDNMQHTVKNCTFYKNIGYEGGAICSIKPTYRVIDSYFKENEALSGGAIYDADATNCIFIKNVVKETYDYDDGKGGALCEGHAYNCTFDSNYARDKGDGGALAYAYAENCIFKSNHAVDLGGAIYETDAVNCTFTENYANNAGGAMYYGKATNCIFEKNKLDGDGKNGGAIYQGDAKNCTFIGNSAHHGGAMNCEDNTQAYTAEGCTFIGNSANGGGATYCIDVVNCIFTNNTSTVDGGAVYKRTAVNCTFTGNTAERDGGAIFKGDAENCTFTGNHAKSSGGAIYMGNASDSIFTDNHADDDGGAIFKGGAINCTFISNKADDNGGAIHHGDEKFTAINCTFIRNSADEGGATFGIDVINCIITNNTSTNEGGAIYDANAVNCTFTGNHAKNSGGAIHTGNAINCNFTDNHADDDGGAIFKGDAINCTFISNKADDHGGAIHHGDEKFTAINCTFNNNSADEGGATYRIEVFNCIFTNNTSTGDGGAVYNSTAVNCTFTGNHANNNGGAIFKADAINCTFIGNSAHNGGAIFSQDSIMSGDSSHIAVNCTFIDNSAEEGGGAIYGNNAENSIFIGNHANDGGAMTSDEMRTAINCTCIGNSARNGGGAILFYDVKNSIFIGNSARYGGATAVSNRVFNCTYINNRADDGSATYNQDILLCYFENNTYNGGDITVDLGFENVTDINQGEHLKVILNKDDKSYNGYNVTVDVYKITESGYVFEDTVYVLSGDSIPIKYTNGLYKFNCSLNRNGIKAHDRNITVHAKLSISSIDSSFIAFYGSDDCFTVTYKDGLGNPVNNVEFSAELKGDKKHTKNYTTDKNGQIKLYFGEFTPDSYVVEIYLANTENYYADNVTCNIQVNKASIKMAAATMVTTYNSSDEFIITLNDARNNPIANVSVSVDLNGTQKHTTDKNGQIKLSINGLTPDTYDVNATFSGNDFYLKSTVTTKIVVNKEISSLMANTLVTVYNSSDELVISLKDGNNNPIANVPVSVDLNGTKKHTTDEKGQIKVSTKGLTPDTYIVDVAFNGNEIYQKSNFTSKIIIDKISTKLNTDAITCEYTFAKEYVFVIKDNQGNPAANVSVVIDLNGPKNFTTDANGQINFYAYDDEKLLIDLTDALGNPLDGVALSVTLNGTKNYTTDKNGQIEVSTRGLTPDTYLVNVSFGGDKYYYESNTTAKITINKCIIKLTANSVSTTYNEPNDLIINLTDDLGYPIMDAQVCVDIDGAKNYTTDKNGQINIPTHKLAPNNYVVKISFGGDEYCLESSIHTFVVVEKATSRLTANSVETTYGENKDLIITLTDGDNHPIANATVTVNLNGNKNYTTDKNGQITIPTGNLTPDNYTVKITYGENDYCAGSSIETMVSIAKSASKLTANSVETTYGENKDIIITLTDSADNPIANATVTVNLNGNKNYKTDKNGQIKIPTGNITPNNYIAKISFEDEYYIASTIETAVVVNKIASKLTANNVTATYNVNNNLIISLKDSEGNPIQNISVSVDLGSVKDYTTDEKGQINIPVQKLVPKTYVAKIKFNGNSYYVGSETADVVVVKKATPKIGAKAKSFKVKTKTKKYAITLKNNKKQAMKNTKVYLKVKGKTYAAKTNSKGKATFKITKLTKKGKFNAAITYKGNKYYKKVTKKTKITIK